MQNRGEGLPRFQLRESTLTVLLQPSRQATSNGSCSNGHRSSSWSMPEKGEERWPFWNRQPVGERKGLVMMSVQPSKARKRCNGDWSRGRRQSHRGLLLRQASTEKSRDDLWLIKGKQEVMATDHGEAERKKWSSVNLEDEDFGLEKRTSKMEWG